MLRYVHQLVPHFVRLPIGCWAGCVQRVSRALVTRNSGRPMPNCFEKGRADIFFQESCGSKNFWGFPQGWDSISLLRNCLCFIYFGHNASRFVVFVVYSLFTLRLRLWLVAATCVGNAPRRDGSGFWDWNRTGIFFVGVRWDWRGNKLQCQPLNNEQNEINQIIEQTIDSLWSLSHASNLLLYNNRLITAVSIRWNVNVMERGHPCR